jgi:hypothetical protein
MEDLALTPRADGLAPAIEKPFYQRVAQQRDPSAKRIAKPRSAMAELARTNGLPVWASALATRWVE